MPVLHSSLLAIVSRTNGEQFINRLKNTNVNICYIIHFLKFY